jgi:DNA-binding response OmpR family regulator
MVPVGPGSLGRMPDVIVAADAPWVVDEVRSVLSGPADTVRVVTAGPLVLPAVEADKPDLVILDLQIGSMGAIAVCMDLRLEEGAGRLDHVPVLVLLDRRADVFLARRVEADGWLLKPLDPIRLRKAVRTLLAGDTYEDPTRQPPTVPAVPGHR